MRPHPYPRTLARLRCQHRAILMLCFVAACGGDSRREPPVRGERTVASESWDTGFSVGGTLQDTLFGQIGDVVHAGDRIYASDLFSGHLISFDREGYLQWRFGGQGSGPGEFLRPMDLELDPSGNVLVLDPRNSRITVVSKAGTLVGTIPLQDLDGLPSGFAVTGSDALMIAVPSAKLPLVVVDFEGNEIERLPHPDPLFESMHPMVRQFQIHSAATSSQVVATYDLADGFSVISSGAPSENHMWYAETVPPLEVMTTSTKDENTTYTTTQLPSPLILSAVGASVQDDKLLVLFGGQSENRGKWIDVFRLPDGAYTHSYALPRSAAAMSVSGEWFAFVSNSPIPMLWTSRPRDQIE